MMGGMVRCLNGEWLVRYLDGGWVGRMFEWRVGW